MVNIRYHILYTLPDRGMPQLSIFNCQLSIKKRYRSKEQDLGPLRVSFSDSIHSDPIGGCPNYPFSIVNYQLKRDIAQKSKTRSHSECLFQALQIRRSIYKDIGLSKEKYIATSLHHYIITSLHGVIPKATQ